MEQKTNKLRHFSEDYRFLIEGRVKQQMLAAREKPEIAITKQARLETATKTHAAITKALDADKIVTIRTRQIPDFEAPATDHNLVKHQGILMLVDPKGRGHVVSQLAPSESGHITVYFKEKGGRVKKPLHLHAGVGAENDMLETEKDTSPYRVSLVGGKHEFRGLPDLSEHFNIETDLVRIMNRLEEALIKKKIVD